MKRRPFSPKGTSDSVYLCKRQREAAQLLTYAVKERKGLILLTGERGVGKTTTVQAFMRHLDHRVQLVYLPDPLMSPEELRDYLAFSAFKNRVRFRSRKEFLLSFEHFLVQRLQRQENFLLVVDDAQDLSPVLMDEIWFITEPEYVDEKLINVVLVGQPELVDRLTGSDGTSLSGRVGLHHGVLPMDLEETREYLLARLKMGGAERGDEIFSKDAVKAIHHLSRGYPGMISMLAERTLNRSHQRRNVHVTSILVEEAYRALGSEGHHLTSRGEKVKRESVGQTSSRKAHGKRKGLVWSWAPVIGTFLLLLFVGINQKSRETLLAVTEFMGFASHSPPNGGEQEEYPPEKTGGEQGRLEQADGIRWHGSSQDQREEARPGLVVASESDGSVGTERSIQSGGSSRSAHIPQGGAETTNRTVEGSTQETPGTKRENGNKSTGSILLQEAHICRKVIDREPMEIGKSFSASLGKLYCFTRIVGARDLLVISHLWYLKGSEMARVDLPVKSGSWRTYSSKTIGPDDVGQWHVDVVGPDGEILKTLDFVITP